MTRDSGGERIPPELGQAYYDAILDQIEDRSDLLMPLSQESLHRVALIDGGEERGWWPARVHAVDEEESIFAVDDPDGNPWFAIIPASEVLDRERAIEKVVEIEQARRAKAFEAFVEGIGDAANPN